MRSYVGIAGRFLQRSKKGSRIPVRNGLVAGNATQLFVRLVYRTGLWIMVLLGPTCVR